MNQAIDRSLATDLLWVAIGPERQAVITTEIERERVVRDFEPAASDFEMVAVPWYGDSQFVDAAVRFLGTAAEALAADCHPAFGRDARADVIRMRLTHTAAAQEELRQLGADTADSLESALRDWVPGEVDRSIQARLVGSLESKGVEPVTVIVSGDERVRAFRHPMASGVPVRELAMAVIVARRGGLHAAATRLASAGPLDAELKSRLRLVRSVEDAVLQASRAGATYGRAAEVLERAYAAAGHNGAWAEHYQGGPIGYAGREFELAPGERGSPWWDVPIESGQAVAWNPSLRGGAKVEDTYLVGRDGLACLTPPGDWPTEPDLGGFAQQRPAVLDVG
ncbi:MAG: M24 family metallopeptidase [Candidatus Dormibacteria bacterium]